MHIACEGALDGAQPRAGLLGRVSASARVGGKPGHRGGCEPRRRRLREAWLTKAAPVIRGAGWGRAGDAASRARHQRPVGVYQHAADGW